MANYMKKDNKIIITNSTKLTEQDKADIALYRSFGYEIQITRKKENKSKAGYKKVEILYYLENVAPADKVKEFTEICEDKNYMAALKWFKDWYKDEKKADYSGEAATLIKDNGKEAEARIKELIEAEEKKKKKKAEEKKKNK